MEAVTRFRWELVGVKEAASRKREATERIMQPETTATTTNAIECVGSTSPNNNWGLCRQKVRR